MGSIVSSITGSVGGNRGGAGLNYNADLANVLAPNTVAQANEQYGNVNNGLANQAGFLQAVQAQNGLGNQSSVFNQLQGVANGTGPNPAQAQLAQATAANTANQASLMAGQRGSSANPALIARQAAMQGAQNQQNAAGQAATMQANQSLNALSSMGNLATSQANQQAGATNAYSQAAQGAQSNVLGGIAAQNNANVGMTSNQNSSNAGISQVAAKQQGDLIGNLTGGVGAAFGLAQGGMVPQKMEAGGVAVGTPPPQAAKGPKSRIGQYFSQMNSPQAQKADNSGGAQAGQAIGKGLGMGLKSLFGASTPSPQAHTMGSDASDYQMLSNAGEQGGNSLDYTNLPDQQPSLIASTGGNPPDVGAIDAMQPPPPALDNGPMSMGDNLGMTAPMMEADGGMIQQIVKMAPMIATMMAAKGGKVPALLSPGERVLSPDKAKAVVEGKADPIKDGKKVPGKPKVDGDKNSYANDTVPASMTPGAIVLPRSITQGKNPGHEAKKFVEAIMAKNKGLPSKGKK